MKLFYRIEDVNNIGPYHSNKADKKIIDVGNCNGRHPLPSDDTPLNNAIRHDFEENMGDYEMFHGGTVRYGFNSLEQLRRWFFNDNELKHLDECGFSLSIYKVPSMYEGHTQCAILAKYHSKKRIFNKISLISLLTPPNP